jgi:uncharacterized protein YijF (DUF1287 family)
MFAFILKAFVLLALLVSCNWSIAHAQTVGFSEQLVNAAKERLKHTVRYDGRYLKLDYPNGDVPDNIGVCTDVVIRSYRALNIDLQELVHEDMKANFDKYPSKRIWGMTKPDTNIDHRRVPNLQAFFERQGASLLISNKSEDYLPGDLVTWMLSGNLPHIGIVVDEKSPETGNYMIVHNIGSGPKMDDILFSYDISGHYRFPSN